MRVCLGLLCLLGLAHGADHTARVRMAAERGLARLQTSQKTWFAKQSCTSCHHQVLPALVFRSAREHDIPFDTATARADAARAFRDFANLDAALQYRGFIDPALGDGYPLLAADAAGVRPSIVTAIYARHLALRQKPDGHWVTSDDRPPQAYSSFTATAIVLRVLQLYGHPSLAADTVARIARARQWLASNPPKDTEECAWQLLGLSWAGKEPVVRNRLANGLIQAQRPDGGWSSKDGLASDAYSTGQALVALHDAAAAGVIQSAFSRGVEFLLANQQPDGSWHVRSRLHPPAPISPPYFESGYPYEHDQFISAMGASWAVMALARALGPARSAEAIPLNEANPRDVEPWVETLLFGKAADLRSLLDGGFDPNSTTSTGTPALMLAVPDLQKTAMLIERGAKANARAQSRYSTLMVAALYPGAEPVVRLLLDKGAEVRMAKGAGAPMFNAAPLMMATFGANARAIGWFRKAGDNPETSMMILGMFPSPPLFVALNFDDVPAIQALLDAGAPVDLPDASGITPLAWAAIENHRAAADVLIRHGAEVNSRDPSGMTPLLYAAAIDFGGPEVIQLLLQSGADPKARDAQGLTALDLARKYGHTHLIPALSAGVETAAR